MDTGRKSLPLESIRGRKNEGIILRAHVSSPLDGSPDFTRVQDIGREGMRRKDALRIGRTQAKGRQAERKRAGRKRTPIRARVPNFWFRLSTPC